MSHGGGLRRATKERRTCALGYARGFDFVRRPDKLPRAGSAESAHRHKAHHVIRIPHSSFLADPYCATASHVRGRGPQSQGIVQDG